MQIAQRVTPSLMSVMMARIVVHTVPMPPKGLPMASSKGERAMIPK